MSEPRYQYQAQLDPESTTRGKATKQDLRDLRALAHIHSDSRLKLSLADAGPLQQIVKDAQVKDATALAKLAGMVATGPVEERDPNPDQEGLNLQLALARLVSDEDAQDQARKDGKGFQVKYNLTNDQMLTLCRLAVDVGAYKDTSDLNTFLNTFSNLDPVTKSLSPDALSKLGLSTGESIIGSCSCCCP